MSTQKKKVVRSDVPFTTKIERVVTVTVNHAETWMQLISHFGVSGVIHCFGATPAELVKFNVMMEKIYDASDLIIVAGIMKAAEGAHEILFQKGTLP